MPESPSPAPASEARPSPSEYREQRLANLAELQARGHAPFGAAFARTGRVADIRAAYAENLPVKAAGRVLVRQSSGAGLIAGENNGVLYNCEASAFLKNSYNAGSTGSSNTASTDGAAAMRTLPRRSAARSPRF